MKKISPSDLPLVSSTIQALDNQWAPQSVLSDMVNTGRSLDDPEISRSRELFVRSEFIRSLINMKSVVINRANLVTSSSLQKLFTKNSDDYNAMRKLFSNGTLIPFLYKENTVEFDRFSFDTEKEKILSWNNFCAGLENISAVRLDWKDDDLNESLIHQRTAKLFHQRIKNLSDIDHKLLTIQLEIPEKEATEFREMLSAICIFCTNYFGANDRYVTRDILYKNFVVQEGSNTSKCFIDRGKKYSLQIKQLIDLIYNTNLSDSIARFPLIPSGSHSRTILQESVGDMKSDRDVSSNDVLYFLQKMAFDIAQQGLSAPQHAFLSLNDVLELRQYDQWAVYINSMESVLKDPHTFANPEGVREIYQNYGNVCDIAANILYNRKIDLSVSKWDPAIKIVLEIGGHICANIIWDSQSSYHQFFNVAWNLITENSIFVTRMVITSVEALKESSDGYRDYETSVVIWYGRIKNAKDQFSEIRQKIEEDSKFHPLSMRDSNFLLGGLDYKS